MILNDSAQCDSISFCIHTCCSFFFDFYISFMEHVTTTLFEIIFIIILTCTSFGIISTLAMYSFLLNISYSDNLCYFKWAILWGNFILLRSFGVFLIYGRDNRGRQSVFFALRHVHLFCIMDCHLVMRER